MDQNLKTKRPPNAWQTANFLSKGTFAYTLPTFFKGLRRKIDEEDVPEVADAHKAGTLGDRLESRWLEQPLESRSLWKAIYRTFGLEFVGLGCVLFVDQLVLRFLRCLALVQLIGYFSHDAPRPTTGVWGGYAHGGLVVALSIVLVFFSQLAARWILSLGMRVRVACATLIYRKCLRSSKSALERVTIGHVTNVMSNDLSRIDAAIVNLHYFWISPAQVALVAVMLNEMFGPIATVGIGFMLLWVPILVYLGRKCSELRYKTAVKTDERIQLTNEIVMGIKAIKMYGWEEPFAKLVDAARRAEVRQILSINYVRGLMKVAVPAPKIAAFIAITAHVLAGNPLTATYAFAVALFYDVIKVALIVNCAAGISQMAELKVSVARIEKLMGLEEAAVVNNEEKSGEAEVVVALRGVTARWRGDFAALNQVGLKVGRGEAVGLVGPVGSGKSSVLLAILGELQPVEGVVSVAPGGLSYAAQDPWLFTGSVRQNVLFGRPFNHERYNRVIRACGLEEDFALWPYADQTLVGERGVTLSGGQRARVGLARAAYAPAAAAYLLDDPFAAVDVQLAEQIFADCVLDLLSASSVLLVTHRPRFLARLHRVYVMEGGEVTASGTYEDLAVCQSLRGDVVTAAAGGAGGGGGCKRFVSEPPPEAACREARRPGDISNKVYLDYFKAGGSVLMGWCVVAAFLAATVCLAASDFFLAFWTNQHQRDDRPHLTYIHAYTGIAASIIVFTVVRVIVYFKFATRVSIGLHNNMFESVLYAPMRFFGTNNSGRIANRFSKDMGQIDEVIPVTMMDYFQSILNIVAAVIMICTTNAWMVLMTGVLGVGFYGLRVVYMRTSRHLARLEATARSPVYAHLQETLAGLITVRAFDAQQLLVEEFDRHQDLHSSVWSLFIDCAKTFGFYIDVLCSLYVAAVVFTTLMSETELAGSAGLALTQSIALINLFQSGMLQSTEMQNKMASVERVVEYSNLTPDASGVKTPPAGDFPADSSIRFDGVSLRYDATAPCALNNVSFLIEPGNKIGIVGRSGSGKSSVVSVLFQLEPIGAGGAGAAGRVSVGGVDVAGLTRDFRKKIAVIPQEPTLFTGNLRFNLDALGKRSDAELWAALEAVSLKEAAVSLESPVTCHGANYSVGQRQLVCLARALLTRNKILVLDEATANVDPACDAAIQAVIRSRFADCTVLTIAHRLDTIADCDKVMVLDAGQLVEYDAPETLMRKVGGAFGGMMRNAGHLAKSDFEM